MANESEILWGTVTDFSDISELDQLGDGDWWQSGEQNDASPSNQFVRISWEIIFANTPVAGDFLWFKIARGDGAASNEIWDGGIGTTEGQITAAAAIAELDQAPTPQWTHHWATSHGSTFKGLKTISLHGHSWQLCISPRGDAISSGTQRVRYQYGTPQLQ